MQEYYVWHEMLLFTRFLQYATDQSRIVQQYVKPYDFMRQYAPSETVVLEVGGGLIHGCLYSLLMNAWSPKKIIYADLQLLHAEFIGWLLESKKVPHEIRYSEAPHSPQLVGCEPVNIAFAKDVFEHVADPEILLSQLYDVLRPGGMFAVDLTDKKAGYQHLSPKLHHLTDLIANCRKVEQFGELSVYQKPSTK
ncbi:MAG: class I SAM-dependent methyltransferase [Candidatus Glassbacteria bacterium]